MGLTSHLSDAYNTFSSFCFSFSLVLSLMMINLTNQNHHSKMGRTSHLFYAYDAFSSFCFSFSLLLNLMKISLMNLTIKVLSPGSPPVHDLFHFSLKILLVV